MELTKEQRAAVELRNRTVLVSAAAGAGKTRVLAERLIGYVADPDEPRDIDEFLVVTYTRAAAGEMRNRITERLRELSGAEPDNAHLRKQLTRVYTARIGTLDAACREILLENAAEAGLPSGYRAGDETELEMLQARVLDETLDALYERTENDPEDPFNLCAGTYGDERGDQVLGGLISHIWQKTRCHADPMGWLNRVTDESGGLWWADILLGHAACVTETFLRDYRRMLPSIRGGSLWGTYGVTMRGDMDGLEELAAVLRRGDWDGTAVYLEGYAFDKLKSYRPPNGEEPPTEAEAFKTLRSRWKKALEKIQVQIAGTVAEHLRDAETVRPLLRGLCDAVYAFDRALTEEKLRLGILDFSDVERLTLSLLAPGGERTALADKLSSRFCEILVDEYQDINPLQDAIIAALSRDGGNVFYVGDARQSIYRFRMAEPRLFTDKYRALPPYTEAPPGAPCRVNMTKNFRSAKPVLDAVNRVFSRVECPETGRLKEEEFLVSGREPGEAYPVELLTGEGGEAERAASRLKELIEKGEARPGECVVLLRSPKNRMPEYRAAMERAGLPCAAAGNDVLARPEMQAMLSALEVISNARLDIPLISVLRSQMVGCTPDELAELRTLSDGALYECLLLSENEKICRFRETLGRWRDIAAELPPYALAARVMADTDFPQKTGSAARENLLLLPELLREFPGELRELPDWLRRKGEVLFRDANAAAAVDAVRILSIHGAKGLEFPVVVVAGLSKRVNLQDQQARLLAHPRLGLGPKRRDEYSEYPTPAYRAIQAVIDGETRAEELRLLYVAMTRAERRLILSCGGEVPEDEPRTVTRGDLILRSNVAAWLLMARDPLWVTASAPPLPCDALPHPTDEDARVGEEVSDWRYPYPEAVETPSKMTATGLAKKEDAGGIRAYRRVEFAASPLTPAERGTATHLFFQYCEYARCAMPGGIEAELARLRGAAILSEGQADAVDTEAAAAFFQSPRGRTLLKANARREQKFSVPVRDGDIPGLTLPPGETVLLQGVIDCYYETDEGLVLLDFKTDRVKPGGEGERAARYKPQIDAYAAALTAMTGKAVKERVLVFLAAGREVLV